MTSACSLLQVIPGIRHRLANNYILVCTTDNGGYPATIVYLGVVCGPARLNAKIKVHEDDFRNDLVFVVQPVKLIGVPWKSVCPNGDHDDLFRWNTARHPIPKASMRVFARAPGLVGDLCKNLREARGMLDTLRRAGTLDSELDSKPFKETSHIRIALLLELLIPDRIELCAISSSKFNVL